MNTRIKVRVKGMRKSNAKKALLRIQKELDCLIANSLVYRRQDLLNDGPAEVLETVDAVRNAIDGILSLY